MVHRLRLLMVALLPLVVAVPVSAQDVSPSQPSAPAPAQAVPPAMLPAPAQAPVQAQSEPSKPESAQQAAVTPPAANPAPTEAVPVPPAAAAAVIAPAPEAAKAADAAPTPAPAAAAAASVAPAPDAKPAEAAPVRAVEAPAVPPPFALATELADRLKNDKTAGLVREDRDAALKFYEARQGAPVWVTEAGFKPSAQALIAEVGKAGDYGLSADAFKLPPGLAAGAARADLAEAEATLTLAALKYARFARGGRMDPQALSRAIDRRAQLLPPAKVLEELASADKPDATLRGLHPQNPQFEKLRQKYLALKAGQPVIDAPPVAVAVETPKGKKAAGTPVAKALSPAALERKLLANMEMWRWMPAFGTYYIQPNIPEFTVSVVKNGHVIHKERIVTGKPDTMTPMFSDEMRLVVFKPFWNVPESIKFKELQPQLLRSGASLTRAGLRADINGRTVDPATVDWVEVDMRQVHIYQPPGEANALGRVKFLFPNKHDVYLHDTPSKSLFAQSSRAFSHGCMRVRDPLKLAEVILAGDKNWTRAQVDQAAERGPENTEVKLATPIPVHITYFTAWVDDDGKLQSVADIYGHENRIQLGLEGKTSLIAQPREERYAPPSQEERRRYADARRERQQAKDPVGDWVKSIFNF